MDRAEKVSLNVFDNIMECLTIYIWPMLVTTHYQKVKVDDELLAWMHLTVYFISVSSN